MPAKRVPASLGKETRNVGFPLALARWVRGMAAPRGAGHSGGTEEMLCSHPVTCKMLELSLSGHKCHLCCEGGKCYRQHFAKIASFAVKLNPQLSSRLLLASDIHSTYRLSCSGFGVRSSCREPRPPLPSRRPLAPPPQALLPAASFSALIYQRAS